MDLTGFAKFQFYAGKPTTARVDELIWKGHDYDMAVRFDGPALVAVMTSGNCEWKTNIDMLDITASIDAALEDACDLGRTANYSKDPERD